MGDGGRQKRGATAPLRTRRPDPTELRGIFHTWADDRWKDTYRYLSEEYGISPRGHFTDKDFHFRVRCRKKNPPPDFGDFPDVSRLVKISPS